MILFTLFVDLVVVLCLFILIGLMLFSTLFLTLLLTLTKICGLSSEGELIHELGKEILKKISNAIIQAISKNDDQCLDTDTEEESSSCNPSNPEDSDGALLAKNGTAMTNDVDQDTIGTALKPSDKRNEPESFGKDSSAMPARILSKIAVVSRFVGYLWCGSYAATCWLLAKDIIITCKHVFSDIAQLRDEKTSSDFDTIKVAFDYTKPPCRVLQGNPREIDEEYPLCVGEDLDYAIYILKPSRTSESKKLAANIKVNSSFMRSRAPRSGRVFLVGHPDGQYKQFEDCQIIPLIKRNEVLRERKQESENHCKSNPAKCRKANRLCVSCVHDYTTEILNNDHPGSISYDTSFFHGSSGSPVFNDNGYIIAMHTGGYPYHKGSKKESLMEFGLTIGAIYEDVRRQEGESKADELFPGVTWGY